MVFTKLSQKDEAAAHCAVSVGTLSLHLVLLTEFYKRLNDMLIFLYFI